MAYQLALTAWPAAVALAMGWTLTLRRYNKPNRTFAQYAITPVKVRPRHHAYRLVVALAYLLSVPYAWAWMGAFGDQMAFAYPGIWLMSSGLAVMIGEPTLGEEVLGMSTFSRRVAKRTGWFLLAYGVGTMGAALMFQSTP
jgi:hypothetical protein